MKITDYPAIAYPAIHFDTKHPLDRMEYYYQSIDKLARYKINGIIWEIEDKLKFVRRPAVATPTPSANKRCKPSAGMPVDVMSISVPLYKDSDTLDLSSSTIGNSAKIQTVTGSFVQSDPCTYEIQFDLYQDALQAMPYGKYLHVGGDEITAIGIDKRCKATGKNTFKQQMYWLEPVCDFATRHGRTPIFGDDMPLKYAGLWDIVRSQLDGEELEKQWDTSRLDKAIRLFPKECIYMRWYYTDAILPTHLNIFNWYRDKGLNVMGTTAAAGDSPFLSCKNSTAGSIRGFSRLIADNQLAGILATAWDDGPPRGNCLARFYCAKGIRLESRRAEYPSFQASPCIAQIWI